MEVLILTQADCQFCDQAKELMNKLSAEYRFEVRTLDVATDEGRELADSGGVLFPPGIFIDGAAVAYGRPSERRLRRELDRRRAARS